MSRIRSWFLRAARAERIDLRGKQMVVTGAAPGSIGFETARQLAGWGADVVITTRRNPEAVAAQLRERIASEPGHGRIAAQALDLADAASTQAFITWLLSTHGERLDVLINNAGIHLDLLSQWKQAQLTPDGQERHWRTNYLGSLHLTLGLLPLLRQTGRQFGEARLINVVSQLHAKGSNADLFGMQRPYNSWFAYGNSKLALMHAAQALQRRHGATDQLKTYSLHPGAVYTHIADQGLRGNPRLEAVRRAFAPVEAFFLLTPEEGAQTSVHCASSPTADGGRYWQRCQPATASADSADTEVARRLLEATEAWYAGLPPQ
ncbi:MAG: SDR family NAD(P)-dependent oxidoreductase [Stagnimonas sp.]|nr:SDR family NAD(P)-dependent oxidoreductase [Stagnimonas sp.]